MPLIGPPLDEPSAPTLVDALASAASGDDGVTFVDLHERETRLPWGELYRRGLGVAAALLELGIEAGDRVALIFPTGPDFFAAFFGAQLAGAVPVPLYPPVRLGRLDEYHAATARMLDRAGARLVLTDGRVRRLLGVAIAAARPELGCRALADLRAVEGSSAALSIRPAAGYCPDALALIQFSSGTTVAPKPVALTHRNLVAQCAALRQLMGSGPPVASAVGAPSPPARHRGVFWLPLYHDMGLVGALSGVYFPGDVVLIPPEAFLARPSLWLRAIARHRGTISTAPSFGYALAAARVRNEELAGLDLSSWRHALDGAEPISPEVCRRFIDRFAPFGFEPSALTPVYGMSEATLALTFTPPGRGMRVLGVDPVELARSGRVEPGDRELVSVGVPVPGAAIAIRDDDGNELAEARLGHVHARGPAVTAGYFDEADADRAGRAGRWLDTGDLGFVDGGELFLCGRAKDVIIVRGANRTPEEFEECLAGVDGLRAGCWVAAGLPTPAGEELLILAERAAGSTVDEATVVERAREAILARTGVRAHTVALLEPGTLPRTSSGKRRRAEALRRYCAEELTPPRSVSRVRIAVELARSLLAFARARTRPGRRQGR